MKSLPYFDIGKKCYYHNYYNFIIIVAVAKVNEPNLLKEYGGHLELTDDWHDIS